MADLGHFQLRLIGAGDLPHTDTWPSGAQKQCADCDMLLPSTLHAASAVTDTLSTHDKDG